MRLKVGLHLRLAGLPEYSQSSAVADGCATDRYLPWEASVLCASSSLAVVDDVLKRKKTC